MTAAAATVRRATPDDLDALAALFDAYRQFYEQPADRAAARAFLGVRLAAGESVILLAHGPDGPDGPDGAVPGHSALGNSALGFCQLYPTFCSVEAAPIAVLYDLYVAPQARRSGTGAALLRAAEDQARQHGWVRLDLTTAHSNVTAQRLYESLGWVQDQVFRTYNRRIAG